MFPRQQINLSLFGIVLNRRLVQDLAQPDHAAALNHYSVIVFPHRNDCVHEGDFNRGAGRGWR